MTFRYRFEGESTEIFPSLPLLVGATAVLEPGDEIETTGPVFHSRLVLVSGEVPTPDEPVDEPEADPEPADAE